jgi:hypothetical protein
MYMHIYAYIIYVYTLYIYVYIYIYIFMYIHIYLNINLYKYIRISFFDHLNIQCIKIKFSYSLLITCISQDLSPHLYIEHIPMYVKLYMACKEQTVNDWNQEKLIIWLLFNQYIYIKWIYYGIYNGSFLSL